MIALTQMAKQFNAVKLYNKRPTRRRNRSANSVSIKFVTEPFRYTRDGSTIMLPNSSMGKIDDPAYNLYTGAKGTTD